MGLLDEEVWYLITLLPCQNVSPTQITQVVGPTLDLVVGSTSFWPVGETLAHRWHDLALGQRIEPSPGQRDVLPTLHGPPDKIKLVQPLISTLDQRMWIGLDKFVPTFNFAND